MLFSSVYNCNLSGLGYICKLFASHSMHQDFLLSEQVNPTSLLHHPFLYLPSHILLPLSFYSYYTISCPCSSTSSPTNPPTLLFYTLPVPFLFFTCCFSLSTSSLVTFNFFTFNLRRWIILPGGISINRKFYILRRSNRA